MQNWEPAAMAKYRVDWNDRCPACGSHAAIIYQQELKAGAALNRVRREVECRNAACTSRLGGA